MKCFFRNKDKNKVFYGDIITSYENFQKQSYINVTNYCYLNDNIYWKTIKFVDKKDILGFYENIENFKKDYPQYFI